jgi:hypothetical protein
MSRKSVSQSLPIAAPIAAFYLVATALLAPDPLSADPLTNDRPAALGETAAPIKPVLDVSDEIAALDAVQIALTEAADGATYVWQRYHGRLNGSVRMTSTFRGGDGRLCRHLVMSLTAGRYTRRTEGIACRDKDKVWSLEG